MVLKGQYVHQNQNLWRVEEGDESRGRRLVPVTQQEVECVRNPERANYNGRTMVARHDMSAEEVNRIYPPPSPEISFRQNMSFIDPNTLGYQEYPGFDIEVPEFNRA